MSSDQPRPSVTPESAIGEQDSSFEVWQDGQPVAWAEGPLEDAWREACRYATVYGQDGPVQIFKVSRYLVLETNSAKTLAERLQSVRL
jgi:hypothetical protein